MSKANTKNGVVMRIGAAKGFFCFRLKANAVVAVVFLFGLNDASALERFDLLLVSIDRTVLTPIGALSRQNVLEQTPEGPSRIKSVPLPANARIAGLDQIADTLFFVPDIAVNIAGITITPRDIARVTPTGNLSKEISASDLSLEPPAKISAITQHQDGFLFSLDITSELNGLNATPQDVLYYNGQSVSLHVAGEPLGIAKTSAISGLGTSHQGNIIFSTTSASADGVASQQRGALYLFTESSNSIERVADYRETLGSCLSCEISAVTGQLNEDVIFRSSFNSNWEAQ